MDSKTRTKVNIGGREYGIAGFESEEYIHRVAIYVDRKTNELSKANPGVSPQNLAILVALNISDELIKKADELSAIEIEIVNLREELKKIKIENALLKENSEHKPQTMKNTQAAGRVFDSLK